MEDRSKNYPSEALLHANWRLMEASRSSGLMGVIEEAGKIFSYPVILFDESFRVIASYPKEPEKIPELQCMIKNNRLGDKSVYRLLMQNKLKSSNYYAPFYAKRGICSGDPLILGELVHSGNIYGHLVVCPGNAPENKDDLELVSLVLHMIELNLSGSFRHDDYRSSSLALRLENLLNSGTPGYLLNSSIEAVSTSLSGRFAVLVAPLNNYAAQYALVEASLNKLREKYKNTVIVFHSHSFVILIGEIRYNASDPVLRPENNLTVNELFEYFEQYDIKPGLSNSFSDLGLTRYHYRQALLCARLAGELRLKKRAVFLDLMPLPALSVLVKANLGYTFIHPVFFQIKKYDREYKTEYEKTLCAFLLNIKDREKTAKELKVHKNTVQYRLTRIEELFDLPLDDSSALLNLIFSACLLKLNPSLDERPEL